MPGYSSTPSLWRGVRSTHRNNGFHRVHVPTGGNLGEELLLGVSTVCCFQAHYPVEANFCKLLHCFTTPKPCIPNNNPQASSPSVAQPYGARGGGSKLSKPLFLCVDLTPLHKLGVDEYPGTRITQSFQLKPQRMGFPWDVRQMALCCTLPLHHGLVDCDARARRPV